MYESYVQEHSKCIEAKKAIVSSINAKREVMLAPAFCTQGEYIFWDVTSTSPLNALHLLYLTIHLVSLIGCQISMLYVLFCCANIHDGE